MFSRLRNYFSKQYWVPLNHASSIECLFIVTNIFSVKVCEHKCAQHYPASSSACAMGCIIPVNLYKKKTRGVRFGNSNLFNNFIVSFSLTIS